MSNLKKNYVFTWLLVFVVVMLAADIWLLKKTVSSPHDDKLPPINIGVLSASSWLIQNQLGAEPASLSRPLNILVLGRSGKDYISPDLTDTILVAHLDNL